MLSASISEFAFVSSGTAIYLLILVFMETCCFLHISGTYKWVSLVHSFSVKTTHILIILISEFLVQFLVA